MLHQTAHSLPFDEVVPDAIAVKGLSRSSLLTQRRRVRVPPQTGISYGAAGAGGGGRQIQFVIADAGGLLDPASINFIYNVQTSGTQCCVDDGAGVFSRLQVNLNGQNLEDVVNVGKYTNAEVKLSCGQNWYKNEGSFAGFELLNNELQNGASPAGTGAGALTGNQVVAYSGAWGNICGNQAAIAARQAVDGATYAWNPFGGEQRTLPLGLMSGVGRMKSYIPLQTFGELNITLFTGSANEACFQPPDTTNGDFSLNAVYCEYDIVVANPIYAELLHRMANDPSEPGLNLPFESTIMASGTVIPASATLSESSIIVSRATQNLLRSLLVLQPSALLNTKNYPSQSAFSHSGAFSIQWRIGSLYFPSIPAQGDASMMTCAMTAYGSADTNENGSCINRELWHVNTTAVGTGANWATTVPTVRAGESTSKFAFADSFIPAYGFQVVKGNAEPLAVDGVSLSGASGSQAVLILQAAPAANMSPYVALVALRFISAHGGGVRVLGA